MPDRRFTCRTDEAVRVGGVAVGPGTAAGHEHAFARRCSVDLGCPSGGGGEGEGLDFVAAAAFGCGGHDDLLAKELLLGLGEQVRVVGVFGMDPR